MKIIVFILLSFFSTSLIAQSLDTVLSKSSTNTIIDNRAANNINAAFYNGMEHRGYPDFYEGHAYFKLNDWQKGTILYEGVVYSDVDLKYDLVTDKVIVLNPNGFSIILFNPRIGWFSLSQAKFIYIPNAEAGIPSGIYQQIASGKMSLLAKKIKIINEDISTGKMIKRFEESATYYAVLDGKYHALKNDQSLLNLVGDKKTQLKHYLKEKGLKFKNNPEATLVSIAEYYNSNRK